MKKILLVHGWSYKFYNSSKLINPWMHRAEFLQLLEKHYHVDIIRLPGFCGESEPIVNSWSTEDFGNWLFQYIQHLGEKYDYLIGYSFGGPVIVHASLKLPNAIPCILVSPALKRADSQKSRIAHFFTWFPARIKNILSNIFLYFASPYYRFGTPFLRKSYKRVVRENSIHVVNELSQKTSITCIYGSKDTATPVSMIDHYVSSNVAIILIPEGGHNIGGTHPEKIFQTIKKITDEI